MENENNETWGVPEAARYLRCSRGQVLLLAQRGDLPGVKIGRPWVFRPETVKAWLAAEIGGQK